MMPVLYYAEIIAMLVTCTVSKVIDLSHKHGPLTHMPIPGFPRYNLTNMSKGTGMLGVYVELNLYSSPEHGGTHMDAPSHFVKGGKTLDQIPLEHTILDGVRIDYSKEAAAKPNFAVTVQMLENWETEFGTIPRESAVLFYFGWYQKFDNEPVYKGTTNVSNAVTYVYPYVTFDAAKWLLDERGIRTIGSDTVTVDPFQINGKLSGFPIHVYYLSNNRLIVENLRDLDKLPPSGFRFHASPVKYEGASGAQIRAYAVIHDKQDSGSHVFHTVPILLLYLAAVLQLFLQ